MQARRARRRAAAFLVLGGVLFGLLLWSSPASAYPWMIRHEYSGCAMCHADPSGGGVLTPYGRAQGDLLLRMHYTRPKPGEDAGEPSSSSRFLWALEPPDWLMLGGSLRGLMLVDKVQGQPVDVRFIQMQADLRAVVRPSFFRAGGSIGFVHEGALPAALTSRPKDNLIAREYWAGVAFKDDAFLLRAGRMNLPFGIRNIDHTLWVRTETRTDINDQQQHGLAFAYNGEKLRGELMGIAGNFQIHPDAYRERGASGYLEYAFAPRYAAGLSGLFTTAQLDVQTRAPRRRGAAGLFGRASPKEPIVLSAEVDALIDGPAGKRVTAGTVGMLQADYQPIQGLHILGTGELKGDSAGLSGSGWFGAWWFFLPHSDLRADGIVQSVASPGRHTLVTMFLTQIHVFL